MSHHEGILEINLELSDVNREYFHWSVNCVLFITLYAVFITQKELVKIEEIEIEKAVC